AASRACAASDRQIGRVCLALPANSRRLRACLETPREAATGRFDCQDSAALLPGTVTMDALPATEITALLGRGTRFEGKLYFEGRVRVDGVFKGEIQSDDTLIVGEGAEVHAEIDVATVIVRGGTVHSNIRASQAIEIHSPGKLIGNISSPSVFIERGVEF